MAQCGLNEFNYYVADGVEKSEYKDQCCGEPPMFGDTPDPKTVKGYKIEFEILCDRMLCEPTCSGEPARYVHDVT